MVENPMKTRLVTLPHPNVTVSFRITPNVFIGLSYCHTNSLVLAYREIKKTKGKERIYIGGNRSEGGLCDSVTV